MHRVGQGETEVQFFDFLPSSLGLIRGFKVLGDAAHTMSPSGGQGLNVAFRDSFVAANHS